MFTKNILMDDIQKKKVNREKLYTWCEEDDDTDILEYLEKLKTENNLEVTDVRIELNLTRKFN